MISVNPKKCPQDHKCPMIPQCSADAISQKGVGLPKVDNSKCIKCGFCLANCPKAAFEEK
jgi:ferredoxin